MSAQNPGVDGEGIATKFFRPDLLGPCAKFGSPFGGPEHVLMALLLLAPVDGRTP